MSRVKYFNAVYAYFKPVLRRKQNTLPNKHPRGDFLPENNTHDRHRTPAQNADLLRTCSQHLRPDPGTRPGENSSVLIKPAPGSRKLERRPRARAIKLGLRIAGVDRGESGSDCERLEAAVRKSGQMSKVRVHKN